MPRSEDCLAHYMYGTLTRSSVPQIPKSLFCMMLCITPLELSSLALVSHKQVPLGMCHFTVFIPQIFPSTCYVLGTLLSC